MEIEKLRSMPVSGWCAPCARTVIRLIAKSAVFALTLVGSFGCTNTVTQVNVQGLYFIGVVECEFADQLGYMEMPQSYYGDYFKSGTGGIIDYFTKVSYNHAKVFATILGPYTISSAETTPYYPTSSKPMTLNQYMGLQRYNQITTCLGSAVDAGANLTPYKEIIALQVNQERLAAYGDPVAASPTVLTALASAVGGAENTLHVQSSAGFPTPPFPAFIAVGAGWEEVAVTSESGPGNTTWTVTRGFQPEFPAVPHNVGDQIKTAFASDIGALSGTQTVTLGKSQPETLQGVGLMTMDPLGAPSVVAQEIGHGVFNLNHSKDFITQQYDYQDAWDVMSVDPAYDQTPAPAFAIQDGYSATKEQLTWEGGPGFNSVYLDYLKWLGPNNEDTGLLASSSCASHGITLDALSQNASDLLEARLPYVSQPGFPAYGQQYTGQYYTVEFRNPNQTANNTVWDSAIPKPTVLVHLAVAPSPGADPYISYLVDGNINGALDISGVEPGGWAGGTPQFVAGSTFADPVSRAYLAVNQIDGSAGIAHVTIGRYCLLSTKVTYTGTTSAVTGGSATLAANLMTNPSSGTSWPVANQPVTFSIGNPQSNISCTTMTDSVGHAACAVTVQRGKGGTKVTASFASTPAYQAASTSAMFQVI